MSAYRQSAITNLDSYKIGHKFQYPKNTTKVYSNFTPRSDRLFKLANKDGHIVWVGTQLFLHKLNSIWNETFFSRSRSIVKTEIEETYAPFCGPNGVDSSHLMALYDLGYLPLEIKALPEGSKVKMGVPVLTITNTKPEFFWLPNMLETWISAEMWQAPTSATITYNFRKLLNEFVELTGSFKPFADWQLHDFSVRGMGSIDSAASSGLGHLLSSLGTDNVPAVKAIQDVYKGKYTFVGGSVPATEHSVMCAGGKESELETFRRLIKTYPSGVLSIVSDTWDFWNVVGLDNSLAMQLKDEILARVPDSLGLAKVVFRPDSGNPVDIVAGVKYTTVASTNDSELFSAIEGEEGYVFSKENNKFFQVTRVMGDWHDTFQVKEVSESVIKGAVECLWDIFGGTTNDKGFRTLNQRVGLIYGDSITIERGTQILQRLADKGFAADNIVFGVGSYTYQYNTRDTFGFAMKATYVELDGVGMPIFKDPKTDNGTKKSAKGLLRVENENGEFVLYDNQTPEQEKQGELRTVYQNGVIVSDESIDTIRARLW